MSANIYGLGATLYVPLNKVNLSNLFTKNQGIRSIIIDCEDSINESEVNILAEIVDTQLIFRQQSNLHKNKKIFIRVRDHLHLEYVKRMKFNRFFDGFVLPKFSYRNASEYFSFLDRTDLIMPIIESDIFSDSEISKTFSFIKNSPATITCMRIGANDILGFFGLRRPRNMIIYDHPIFSKYFTEIYIHCKLLNLPLAGPVCDFFSEASRLVVKNEVLLEKNLGIFTKSAIHPEQVKWIEEEYCVTSIEFESSQKLISQTSAITSHNKEMLEKVTHNKWAHEILNRAAFYGIKSE